MEDGVRDFDGFQNFSGLDPRRDGGGGVGNHGNGLGKRSGAIMKRWKRKGVGGKQVEDGQILCGENAVKPFETERTFAVQEIGNVRLLKACGARESGSRQYAAFDAAQYFEAKVLVKGIKPHAETLAYRKLSQYKSSV